MGEIQKNDKQLSMDFSPESAGNTEKAEKKELTAITTELEKAEVPVFGKRDTASYNKLKNNIEKGFTKASAAYVDIACALWQIHHNEYYRIDNYKNIAEFALDAFEIKKTATHNYIRVVEKFGNIADGKATGLQDAYKDFKCSQLVNMLSFTPEQIEAVQPDWSVRKIIEFGKQPLAIESEETEDSQEIIDSEATDVEDMEESEAMNSPEVETGRVPLKMCNSFEELLSCREQAENVYNDMKNDNHFKNKKIRYVLELIYE